MQTHAHKDLLEVNADGRMVGVNEGASRGRSVLCAWSNCGL